MEAIDRQEPFMLADELGDLLLQIVIHAKIAQKHGEFDPLDVSSEIARKMIRRHPHIFWRRQGSAQLGRAKTTGKDTGYLCGSIGRYPECDECAAAGGENMQKSDGVWIFA